MPDSGMPVKKCNKCGNTVPGMVCHNCTPKLIQEIQVGQVVEQAESGTIRKLEFLDKQKPTPVICRGAIKNLAQPGALYVHYRTGFKYQLIELATGAGSLKDNIYCHYMAVSTGQYFVRPIQEFFELILTPHGEWCLRFTLMDGT